MEGRKEEREGRERQRQGGIEVVGREGERESRLGKGPMNVQTTKYS